MATRRSHKLPESQFHGLKKLAGWLPYALCLLGVAWLLVRYAEPIGGGAEGFDFFIYYRSIVAFRADPDTLYAWTSIAAQGERPRDPFLYPPFATLALGLFTLLPQHLAWPGWVLFECAVSAYTVWGLLRLTRARVYRWHARVSVGVAALLVPLAWWEFSLGQVNLLVLALVVGALHAHFFRRSGLAVSLAIAAAGIKLYPLVLVPLLVIWAGKGRRLRTAAIAALAGLAAMLLPAIWMLPSHGAFAPLAALELNVKYVDKVLLGAASHANFEALGPQDAQNWSVPATTVRLYEKAARNLNAAVTDSSRLAVRRVAVALGLIALLGAMLLGALMARDRWAQCAVGGIVFPLANLLSATAFSHHMVALALLAIPCSLAAARRRKPNALPWAAALVVWTAAIPFYLWAAGYDLWLLNSLGDRGVTTAVVLAMLSTLFAWTMRPDSRIRFGGTSAIP